MKAAAEVRDFKKGRVPREVRVRQLLDLAEGLFIDRGFEGFSIEDLCRAAGVSRPVVYEHFGSKEGIYLACQRRIRDEFDDELTGALASAGSDDVIRKISEIYFGTLEDNPKRWLFAFGSSAGYVGPMADDLFEMRRKTTLGLTQIVGALRPDLDEEQAQAVAHMVSGSGESLGRWWLRNPHIPRERIVAYNVDATTAVAHGITAYRRSR